MRLEQACAVQTPWQHSTPALMGTDGSLLCRASGVIHVRVGTVYVYIARASIVRDDPAVSQISLS